ncbi:MAG: hypothetical protein G5663_01290 [Serratia symbiotica]|nr:hypothetical protein [Serratia symbiotica]
MAEQPQVRAPGPARGALDIGQRIITIVVGMVETRLRLAVIELEEEKANIIQLLVMAGLTLLFTAFGLMSLLILIFWAIDPLYRLIALWVTTGVLLFLAIVGTTWTLVKVRRTTLLGNTRKQLAIDHTELAGEP